MEYRRATSADAGALAAMNWQLIRDEGHRNPMSVGELAVRMAEWLRTGYDALIFESNGTPLGYALYRFDPEHVYLRQFFVRSESRRQGIGRAAIEWLCENVWGASRIRIEVLVGNAVGIAFWRSVGFQDYCLTLEMDEAGRQFK